MHLLSFGLQAADDFWARTLRLQMQEYGFAGVEFIMHSELGISPVALGPNLKLLAVMTRLLRSLIRRARAEARLAAWWRRFRERRAAEAAAAAAAALTPPPLSDAEEHYAEQK